MIPGKMENDKDDRCLDTKFVLSNDQLSKLNKKRPRSKKPFVTSITENLKAYPRETTIHGVKYLVYGNRSLPERIIWITIFIVSLTCLGYFVFNIVRNWIEFPVMLVANKMPTHIFKIPFPAITICPTIKLVNSIKNPWLGHHSNMSSDKFWETKFGKEAIMMSQICRPGFTTNKEQMLNRSMDFLEIDPNWHNTLYSMSPKLEAVIKYCQMLSWYDNSMMDKSNENCQKLFSPITTNEGACFTFNTINEVLRRESVHKEFTYYDIPSVTDGWHPEMGYTKHFAYPYKGIVKGNLNGVTGGLTFTLLATKSDVYPICNPSSLGYKIVLHSPSVYPHTYDKFIALDYGMEYIIAIRPKRISTSKHLKSLSPETRQCFFNRERQLKYYTYYNEQNCKLECYTNYTVKIFGGVPFSSPRDENISNIKLSSSNLGWGFPNYYGLLNEYNKIFNSTYNTETPGTLVTDCNCLPECVSLHYDSEILAANSEVFQSIREGRPNITVNKFRTTVELIFEEPSFIGRKRVEMYTFETFIADFGGLMGLFLGGSMLSLFELFYFLAIRNRWSRN